MSIQTILAQSNALGNERAQSILNNSIQLTQATSQSWERIWDQAINPSVPLWQATLYLGGFIFYVCIILEFVQIHNKGVSQLKTISIKIGTSAIFLVNNGYITASILRLMQAISQYFVSLMLNFTLAGVRIDEAIGSIQNTSAAKERTSEIFAECVDKIGTALDQCINDPVKLEQAEELINALNDNARPLIGTVLEDFVNGIVSNLTAVITMPVLNAMQIISNIIQWCFMNLYESAALGAALFFPIFLGLVMLPGGNDTLAGWFGNYIKLLLFPIAYVLQIGFVALVISGTEQAGLPIGATFVDTAYAVFISVFAPIFAWVGIQKGASGIYEATTSSAKTTAEGAITVVSAGSDLALKMAQIKKLGV